MNEKITIVRPGKDHVHRPTQWYYNQTIGNYHTEIRYCRLPGCKLREMRTNWVGIGDEPQ